MGVSSRRTSPRRASFVRRLWRLTLATLALATAPLAAWSQDAPIPERFATTQSATDYPGGDLTPLFDVTLERCHATCLRLDQCLVFTYDQRNGACFPKASVGDPVAFEGALSGVITIHDEAVLDRAREARAALGFLDEDDVAAAREQAFTMAERYQADGLGEAELLANARTSARTQAVRWTGAAVTVSDRGGAWLAHARALADEAERDRNLRFELHRQAVNAAVNAALRLDERARADALVVMAASLEVGFRGQAALAALRLADALRPGIAPDELARLRERFGFRVITHEVDASTAAPRICVSFSEELAPSRDYAPFVVTDVSGSALEVQGRQLCVSGVAYGERYALTLRAGLPGASGDALMADVPLDVYVRDRDPSVRFPGRGYVLPVAGPRALPVETVNADHLELRLLRVSDRNLVAAIREGQFAQALGYWEGERFESLLAEPVWQGEARLDGQLNRATTSRLPLDEVGPLEPGVYVLRASVPGAEPFTTPPATQWFLVSDLGVTTLAGTDGLHVVVQRLSDGQPVPGLSVALVARSNRVLAEALSDDQGSVRFATALTLGTGATAPMMVLVEGEDDMAVLSLDDAEFDLSDRGVAGREAPGPIDLFLTTDRGAYRPGEHVHVTALARDHQARAIPGLPLSARLLRPDGLEYARVLSEHERAGGHVFSLSLGADVPRGIWRVEVRADPDAPALASRTVLVEDFVPERIDVEIRLDDAAPIDPTAPPSLVLEARHAFGPPAAGLPLSGSVRVVTSDELDGWPGYRFGRFDERVDAQRLAFAPGFVTDADGRLEAPLPLDRLTLDPRPYRLEVRALIVDGSSRPVERVLTRALRPTAPVVGIRPGFDGALPENAEAAFDLALVDPDGAPMPGDLRWQLDRVQTRYQWFSLDGRWYWEPVSDRQRVADGVVSVSDGPARIAVPVTWGPYELRVTRDGPTYASTSVPFTAGWYAVDTTRETPDLLELSLDATHYAPGDTARLRIVPEHPGVALVSVLSDRVVAMQLVAVEGETTVELPVTEDWGAGAYVTASLIHPSDGPEHLPARSLGLAHASVPPGERALEAVLLAPSETLSRQALDVVLELPGHSDGPAFATVAAVDLGVLTLTGFDAPDPVGYLFGQRRLGVAIRDLYGRLIDAREGAMGQVRSGGGLEPTAALSDGPVPAEDVLAFFSGPVEVVDGRAELSFDLPAFDGTVRVMAVVWTAAAVGQAQADVLVRDPVVVQASLPRFMTPGDESRLRLELTHVSGAAGEMTLAISGHGLGDVPSSVTLEAGARAVLDLPLRPSEVGTHTYQVTLTTPDGLELAREVRLSVLHTDPETARTTRVVLAPGETFRFDDEAMDGFREGTARATLIAGAGAALDLPGLVQRLVGYPYGCTEQIASGLQPLLLAPQTVVQLGLMSDAELNERVQTAIDRILTRQGRGGGFGPWGSEGFDLWLDAYVTDVLLRAEAHGASVPPTALRMALDNLRNHTAQAGSLFDGATAYAYAFYVLARAGEAAIGDLRYYADTLAERFDTPLAAAQLGAALAAYGERERSEAMFAQARDLTRAAGAGDPGGWRSDYGTALRDQAGLLALAAEAGSAAVDRLQLASLIARRGAMHTLSTQEAAWALRAAMALGAEAQGLTVDGRSVVGNVVLGSGGAPALIGNAGDADVLVTLTVFGVPEEAPAAGGSGYTIRRSHYTLDGEAADLADVRVGDRLVTLLEIRPDRGVAGGRLMIDDPLPAGFEIDNANLLREGDVRALDWLAPHDAAAMTEARSDRFLAAVDWTNETALRLAYVVRAVSPGEFHHAAAAVEDMYRPTERAVGATGRVIVRP
jgi:alpha-2-macroglobulin